MLFLYQLVKIRKGDIVMSEHRSADDLFDLLERLDSVSGEVQQIEILEQGYWYKVFDIAWKDGIHFVVHIFSAQDYKTGMYSVEKSGEQISLTYRFGKVDDNLLRRMQRVIDEIDSGKYKNKKTLSEKITSIVNQRGLVSYMNNTKWRELLSALKEELPDIELQYKTLFEEESPDVYWEFFGDEYIEVMNYAQIEWFRIKCVITEITHIGMLVPPKVKTYDKKDEILKILKRYSISYEYDENKGAFLVYGYK